MFTRRTAMALTAAAGLAPAACSRASAPPRDVIAAGQPAALLVWAVARERLAGWPEKPDPQCLAGLPPTAARLPQLGDLTGSGHRASVETLAALRPRLIIDYGDIDPDITEDLRQTGERLATPWTMIDGALAHIPDAFRQAGRLLDDEARGRSLAEDAEEILADWRKGPAGPSFYYAKGRDGLRTGFRGALATEVLEGAGWTNVAVGGMGVGPATMEQVQEWDPEVLVTLNADFAHAIRHHGGWRDRPNGGRRRILLMPDRPFGWVDRPPSVNRLLGCAWLAAPEDGPTTGLARLSRRLYGMAPAEIQLPKWTV